MVVRGNSDCRRQDPGVQGGREGFPRGSLRGECPYRSRHGGSHGGPVIPSVLESVDGDGYTWDSPMGPNTGYIHWKVRRQTSMYSIKDRRTDGVPQDRRYLVVPVPDVHGETWGLFWIRVSIPGPMENPGLPFP